MHSLFQYDGFIVQLANKITDTICLSVLWLVTSLPIFTIGAASAALYYSINKCVRRAESGVWSTYWQAFRANFKQATGLWMILMAIYGILFTCCYCSYLMCINGYLPKELFYFLLIVIAVVTLWTDLLLPYLAKFKNTIPVILKNCIYILIMNFPVALMLLVIFALCILGVSIFPLAILCAPGIYTVLACYGLEPVFRKYMSEEDRKKEEALELDA